MAHDEIPQWFSHLSKKYGGYMKSLDQLGEAIRREGPLNEKEAQLVQLAASAAIRSEGAVHSHARRAMEAGASYEEITHTLILITSTVGFPTVSAALSWVDDLTEEDPTEDDG